MDIKNILKKEVLTIKDLMSLFGVGYSTAAKKMREIQSTHNRLGIRGICHIQDYKEHFNLPERALEEK